MSKKKITELPNAPTLNNAMFMIIKGGQSQKASFEMIKNLIKSEIIEENKDFVVPNLEVTLNGNEVMYKINNINYDTFLEIKNDVKIALVRYKRYNRIIDKERSGVKDWIKGNKWTVIDDTTTSYEPKGYGANVANMGSKVFWSEVRIKPVNLDLNSYLRFTKYPLTADNIIDRYAYSNISQQDAVDELLYLRYGSSVNQIIKNDLSIFYKALNELEHINLHLDITIKTIDEGKLKPQVYCEWLIYNKNKYPKIIDAISKGKKLVDKLVNIDTIPNNAKHSEDFKSLITLTKSGLTKIETTQVKFNMISERLAMFSETYRCRKSGSFCADLECKKRNDKMSIKYALKTFPLKYVLYLIVFRKR